ncbi:acyclic terpene utilization AtuA family protein [Aeromicrobium massiliense]|uniref:acyclic terpene utilization AtuA family protein n=1 Tax=Aeromicrobium massiliense TaxID=1464554 RepID=UPI0003144207|nr:acyclic terpene utilization AtuA family protein [Aeromicrobium massiliense]
MTRAPVRIGNASGFYGDRLSAAREMLEGGDLDYLTGDWLAELTMLILGRDRMKDPALGYAKTFVAQMRDTMALAKERGVRVVSNAGGLNPAGLADALRAIAAEQGLDVTIAHVEGDDLLPRAAELGFPGVLTANAYLGGFGIAEALRRGADVVVTGRVTDASVVVGPAIAHHGWGRDDLDALAGAVVAGHVIECGTQATGGNFSGFTALDVARPLGFPLAEVAADGSCVITKHAGTGGAVTVDTVTAQLVYEIQGPLYAGPDVVTDLGGLTVEQEDTDRVRVSGARGSVPPPDAKVCLNELGGFRNGVELLVTGLDVDAKVDWVRTQVEAALDPRPQLVEWHLERAADGDPLTQAAATSRLRCTVKDPSPDPVGRAFSSAVVELALASYPGFAVTAPPAKGAPFGVYRAAYVPQDEVPHRVVLASGETVEIDPPARTVPVPEHVEGTSEGLLSTGSRSGAADETTDVPLGRLLHARSGDKGGDANVGVWVPADHPRRDEAYAWLVAWLTPDRVRALLPEADGLDVVVQPLPGPRAVNVVLPRLLGDGVAASTRLDPQAKGLGEWLRARVAAVPAHLLVEGER